MLTICKGNDFKESNCYNIFGTQSVKDDSYELGVVCMKKKVLAFLLATSMLISMTGCDKKRNTGVDDNKDEKVTTATDNPVDDEKKTADASADTTDADSKDNNDKVNLLDINNMNVIKDIVVKAKGGSEINFCDERICVRNIENENSIVYL